MEGAFRRINFFKGFATTAEDWQAVENYHAEKRRLHNKYFHPPGVIRECLGGLAVTATRDGSALHIEPGMALDEEGRELYLPQSVDLGLDLQAFKSKTIYVAIEYKDQQVDFRDNAFNSNYAGHAFIEELPSISVTADPPDNRTKLELARIALAPDVASVKDPTDPSRPERNEINRLFVNRTGRFRAQLENIADVLLEGTRTVAGSGTTLILIQHDQPSGEHHFYVSSVSPVELKSDRDTLTKVHQNQGLQWKILVRWMPDNLIAYQLEIANSSPVDMLVAYKVYRFR
jgi:hypothetical protein